MYGVGRTSDAERLTYVVAYEPDVDGFTVRDIHDVSPARFEAVAVFGSYEEADWLIRHIKKCGGLDAWRKSCRFVPHLSLC